MMKEFLLSRFKKGLFDLLIPKRGIFQGRGRQKKDSLHAVLEQKGQDPARHFPIPVIKGQKEGGFCFLAFQEGFEIKSFGQRRECKVSREVVELFCKGGERNITRASERGKGPFVGDPMIAESNHAEPFSDLERSIFLKIRAGRNLRIG